MNKNHKYEQKLMTHLLQPRERERHRERERESQRGVDEKGFPSVILKQAKTTPQRNPTANSDVALSVFSTVIFPSPRKIYLFLYCIFAFNKV
jgi:hypothetical protein